MQFAFKLKLAFLLIVLGLYHKSDAQIQCFYIEAGETKMTELPLNIPIFVSTGNKLKDSIDFEARKQTWLKTSGMPDLASLIASPVNALNVLYYRIGSKTYNEMSEPKRAALILFPTFYNVQR